jgi:hypothetical protein
MKSYFGIRKVDVVVSHAVAFQLLLCPVMAFSAEKLATAAASPARQIIAEDNARWKRDPFAGTSKKTVTMPPSGAKTSAHLVKMMNGKTAVTATPEEELQLQGILKVDGSYHALVNGQVIKPGGMIAGVTVTTIKRYGIVVKTGGKETREYDIYQGRIDRGKQ